jgi:hypothetical protein
MPPPYLAITGNSVGFSPYPSNAEDSPRYLPCHNYDSIAVPSPLAFCEGGKGEVSWLVLEPMHVAIKLIPSQGFFSKRNKSVFTRFLYDRQCGRNRVAQTDRRILAIRVYIYIYIYIHTYICIR